MDIIKDRSLNVTTGLVFIATFLLVYLTTRRRMGVPLGPPCWPVIGNLLSFTGPDVLGQFLSLRQRYGDVYGVYFGSELVVVLNGYDCIHDALVKQGRLFSKRPENQFTKLMLKDISLVFENGHPWKVHKSFVLNAFKSLCLERSGFNLERIIQNELIHFLKKLQSFSGPVDVSRIISVSLSNVMYRIIHGRRAEYDDKKFIWYLDLVDYEFKVFCHNQLKHFCFPFLIYLPGDFLNSKRAVRTSEKLKQYFIDICKENISNYKDGDHSCLIDFWLSDIERGVALKEENMWKVLHELMSSGSETTATTIKWLVLCLAKYPDFQRQLQLEIDTKLHNNEASLTDKEDMPLVQATIYEALRIGNCVPFGVPHSVPHDTVFKGYVIPKDTTIFPNISSINLDPRVFKHPREFNPRRFLDKNGTKLINLDKIIPFSIGPRSCLGETIAKAELFLYTVSLVQNFEFQEFEECPLPSLLGIVGITYRPQDFKVRIVRRNYAVC